MKQILKNLLLRANDDRLRACEVISWASPIAFFGDAERARIATVGINPSNREFVDESGFELTGVFRRFPTLASCGIDAWENHSDETINIILEDCKTYFDRSPYGLWFNKLEAIISQTSYSYYSSVRHACHLDIVPFATMGKWMSLSPRQKSMLISASGECLASTIAASQIELVILNGKSVVEMFSRIFSISLDAEDLDGLSLKRRTRENVVGTVYTGNFTLVGKNMENRIIKVIGFNHNIQSSFGITRQVIRNLSCWVGKNSLEDYPIAT